MEFLSQDDVLPMLNMIKIIRIKQDTRESVKLLVGLALLQGSRPPFVKNILENVR